MCYKSLNWKNVKIIRLPNFYSWSGRAIMAVTLLRYSNEVLCCWNHTCNAIPFCGILLLVTKIKDSRFIYFRQKVGDRNTRLNMSSDVNVPLSRTHYMRSSFIYRGAVALNALPNDVKDSGSLSAFIINLKRHIRTLWISTCSPCMYYRGIIVVLFNQGLVEKQLFITDERVTLNKYISKLKKKKKKKNDTMGRFAWSTRTRSFCTLRLMKASFAYTSQKVHASPAQVASWNRLLFTCHHPMWMMHRDIFSTMSTLFPFAYQCYHWNKQLFCLLEFILAHFLAHFLRIFLTIFSLPRFPFSIFSTTSVAPSVGDGANDRPALSLNQNLCGFTQGKDFSSRLIVSPASFLRAVALRRLRLKNLESGIWNLESGESGIWNLESGIGYRESGIGNRGNRESGIRRNLLNNPMLYVQHNGTGYRVFNRRHKYNNTQ